MATTVLFERAHSRVRWASGAMIVAGMWLIIAPYVFNYHTNGGSIISDIVAGVVVLVLAGILESGDNYRLSWPSQISALVGLWLIAAPFVLGYASGSAALMNDIILGVIVAALALTNIFSLPADEEV